MMTTTRLFPKLLITLSIMYYSSLQDPIDDLALVTELSVRPRLHQPFYNGD